VVIDAECERLVYRARARDDGVGPSLRWATVPSIVKNEKRLANARGTGDAVSYAPGSNQATNGRTLARIGSNRPLAQARARAQAPLAQDEYEDPF